MSFRRLKFAIDIFDDIPKSLTTVRSLNRIDDDIFDDRQKQNGKEKSKIGEAAADIFTRSGNTDKYAYHLNKSRQPSRYSTAFKIQVRHVKRRSLI